MLKCIFLSAADAVDEAGSAKWGGAFEPHAIKQQQFLNMRIRRSACAHVCMHVCHRPTNLVRKLLFIFLNIC